MANVRKGLLLLLLLLFAAIASDQQKSIVRIVKPGRIKWSNLNERFVLWPCAHKVANLPQRLCISNSPSDVNGC